MPRVSYLPPRAVRAVCGCGVDRSVLPARCRSSRLLSLLAALYRMSRLCATAGWRSGLVASPSGSAQGARLPFANRALPETKVVQQPIDIGPFDRGIVLGIIESCLACIVNAKASVPRQAAPRSLLGCHCPMHCGQSGAVSCVYMGTGVKQRHQHRWVIIAPCCPMQRAHSANLSGIDIRTVGNQRLDHRWVILESDSKLTEHFQILARCRVTR